MAVETDPVTAQRAVAAGALLVDVRELWEWQQEHVAGAVHIPMQEVVGRVGEIPADRDVYVLCHSGARSAAVAEWLAANGRPRAVNIAGGIARWSAEGLPTE